MTSPASRIQVHCRRSFLCLGCGCRYRREFIARPRLTGDLPFLAVDNAIERVRRRERRSLDDLPCPKCRRRPPWEVRRIQKDWTTMLLIMTATIVVTVAAIWVACLLQPDACLAATLIPWAVLLAFMVGFGVQTRKALAATHQQIRDSIGNDRVVIEPRTEEPLPPDPTIRLGTTRRLAAIGFGVLGLAPSLLPYSKLPMNLDASPPLLAPGDAFHFRFPHQERSASGNWSGTPKLAILEPEEFRSLRIPATGSSDSWTDGRSPTKNESLSSLGLRCSARVPENSELAGRTLVIAAEVAVRYPAIENSLLRTRSAEYKRELIIHLVSADDVREWRAVWFACLGGLLLIPIGPLLARRSLRISAMKPYWPTLEIVDARTIDSGP